MRRRGIRSGLSILGSCALGALGALVSPASAVHASTPCTATVSSPPTSARQGTFLGIVTKQARGGPSCASTATRATTPGPAEAKFHGKPPLLNNGGPVMGTVVPGHVTLTPLYWDPSGTIPAGYKTVVDQYVTDVAHDSGSLTNVYSVDLQLGIHYDFHAGAPVTDTDPFPSSGCTPDSRAAYSDSSGYSGCLTDAQIQSELSTFLPANTLPQDIAHLYLVLLPKGVESCFNPGAGTGSGCSTPWAAGFCAYHSSFGSGAPPVYADLPFPSYTVPGAPFTCASTVESPNGNADADVMISLVSHEANEAITDPYGSAWLDIRGNEIGDECAYIYGPASGVAGAEWNQTISGHHYFTQEEASNEDYTFAKKKACVQQVDMPAPSFKVKPKAPKALATVTFDGRKSQGGGLTFSWNFGDGSPAASGNMPTHVYASTGGSRAYTVTLTLTDDVGLQHTVAILSRVVTVSG